MGSFRNYETSFDKSKILAYSVLRRPSANIRMNGKTLEEVGQFKYLGSTQTKDGTSIKEVKPRHSAMTNLAVLWTMSSLQW